MTYAAGSFDRVESFFMKLWNYKVSNRNTQEAAQQALDAVRPEVEKLLAQQKEELGAVVTRAQSAYDAATAGARREQVGGDHYAKHAIQPWDVIDAYGLDFYAGNALKYLLRYKDKNGVEDLKKARHYLDKLIEMEEAAQADKPTPVPLSSGGHKFLAGLYGGTVGKFGDQPLWPVQPTPVDPRVATRLASEQNFWASKGGPKPKVCQCLHLDTAHYRVTAHTERACGKCNCGVFEAR